MRELISSILRLTLFILSVLAVVVGGLYLVSKRAAVWFIKAVGLDVPYNMGRRFGERLMGKGRSDPEQARPVTDEAGPAEVKS